MSSESWEDLAFCTAQCIHKWSEERRRRNTHPSLLIMLGYAMSHYEDQLSKTAERLQPACVDKVVRGQIKSVLKGKDSFYSKQIRYMPKEVQEEPWQ